jgi:hypothetical protein
MFRDGLKALETRDARSERRCGHFFRFCPINMFLKRPGKSNTLNQPVTTDTNACNHPGARFAVAPALLILFENERCD